MASPKIQTPAEIIFDNTDAGAASTPASGETLVGIDQVTKKLYSIDDGGTRTDYDEGGGGGGGGSGIMGQDEGVPLGTGTTLNVVGNNIQMSLSGSVLRISHTDPAFPAELIGIMGQDEGVNLGTGTLLNVTGDDIQMSLSGSVLTIHHANPASSAGLGILGQDEGVPLGTGTTLNVVGSNIALSISGSILNLTHTDTPVTFPAELIGIYGKDEGGDIGTGTVLNVVGDNISLSLSGTTLTLAHTNPTFPQDNIGIMGWDEGIPQGTGTILNVTGGRALLSRSGIVLNLDISPDPAELIGVFGRNQGSNLGTGTTIDWGLGMNAAISGTVLFVHPFGNGSNGQIWKRDTGTAQGTAWDNNLYNIQWFLGDGTNVVSTGALIAGYAFLEVPDDSVIDAWTVFADATGSVKANIYRSTYAGFPPTSPIAGLGQPVLTNQRKNTGTPTGTTALAKGDVLLLEVPSSATVKLVTVSLQCRKV